MVVIGAVRLGLSVLSFSTVKRAVERSRGSRVSQPQNDELVAKIISSIKLAARYVPGATCLTQACATLLLLSQFDQPAFLRIGVAKSPSGKLEAHAWVESGGAIVIGDLSDLSRYHVLSPNNKQAWHERNLRHT